MCPTFNSLSIRCRAKGDPRASSQKKYAALENKETAYEELTQLLISAPEAESLELLRRLRTGGDVEAVVALAKEGDLLLQMALVPESRYRYEFPYVRDMPPFLQHSDNPYLYSTIYEWTSRPTATSEVGSSSGQQCSAGNEEKSPYLKPFHAAVLVDPLLDSVQPFRWTTVSRDDKLMRDLLRIYFLREHMWFTYLNKNLFLEDMASGSTRFCSSLLVNAILAFACVSYP
jgi:hypothetical protein